MATLKEQLGCCLNERWKTELILKMPKLAESLGLSWLDLCNRSEALQFDPATGGRICQWQFSSQLTVSRVFPKVSLRLLKLILKQYPVNLSFASDSNISDKPECSILFAIGGIERFPQFELALASARAQVNIDYEIVVVEQSPKSLFRDKMPGDIRYFHQVNLQPEQGFNKSWAINKAAKEAKSEKLIILDADYIVPINFVSSCSEVLDKVPSVRLGRLIFHLDHKSTSQVIHLKKIASSLNIEKIVQNNPTPQALLKSVYWDIGGHDEDFWGWGGEDTEFLDRLRVVDISEGGWLPLIHLWHPSAPKKANGDRNNRLYEQKLRQPTRERITNLTRRNSVLYQ